MRLEFLQILVEGDARFADERAGLFEGEREIAQGLGEFFDGGFGVHAAGAAAEELDGFVAGEAVDGGGTGEAAPIWVARGDEDCAAAGGGEEIADAGGGASVVE